MLVYNLDVMFLVRTTNLEHSLYAVQCSVFCELS